MYTIRHLLSFTTWWTGLCRVYCGAMPAKQGYVCVLLWLRDAASRTDVCRRVNVNVPVPQNLHFGTVDPKTGTWELMDKSLGAGVAVGPHGAQLLTATPSSVCTSAAPTPACVASLTAPCQNACSRMDRVFRILWRPDFARHWPTCVDNVQDPLLV